MPSEGAAPMETPIFDFVRAYADSGTLRLHMPGHKGLGRLGCESWDITEIAGADALYEAEGIIAAGEANAAALYGTARTLFSTEGSSQCIRAMLFLALQQRAPGTPPRILAGRNAHKAFVYAAALCGAEPEWLYGLPGEGLTACTVTPEAVEQALRESAGLPAAVYVTSPDYLGRTQDISALADVCRRFGVPLLVDNAHGAHLRFLPEDRHPITLGADLCCDSAHKTLPVLTGGAYLHISPRAPAGFAASAKQAMALFGSTSPSYLTLCSLDLCGRALSRSFPEALAAAAEPIASMRRRLRAQGWDVLETEPLHLSIAGDGLAMAARLRKAGIEPEYAARDALTMLLSPETVQYASLCLPAALGENDLPAPPPPPDVPEAGRAAPLRDAVFAPQETVPVSEAVGRICGAPTVSCPPAVPAVVSGERVSPEAAALMDYYGIKSISVLK